MLELRITTHSWKNIQGSLLVKVLWLLAVLLGVISVFVKFNLIQLTVNYLDPTINTRQDIIIKRDINDPSRRLSYTAFIYPNVNHIRTENFVLERNGVISDSEQLEYCSVYVGIHICTDNKYPIMHRMNGVIELQESSHNKDLWYD